MAQDQRTYRMHLCTSLGVIADLTPEWRTLLPRKASDTIVKAFLDHGASVWVLRASQIGGHDPEIAPIAPMTL
jgi:predicted Abi (CAAX) family protease